MSAARVAFIITGLGTGGAEHMLVKLLEAGAAASAAAMVVSLRDAGDGDFAARIQACGAELVCCQLNRASGLIGLWRAWRRLRVFRPTVVQGWMYHGNLFASLLGRFLPGRPPVFWSMRQTLYSLAAEPLALRLIIRMLATLSQRVGCVIYNSALSLTQHQSLGIVSRRDVMIPNGFDLSRFRPDSAARARLRQRLGVAEDALLVGIVARVHPMKDHANFIAAAAHLAARLPQVRFLLAGAGTEAAPMRAALARAGLAQRAICLGRVDDTDALYPGLDLLVLASAWGEGWPNVLGEAMACSVPCVATDVGESCQILGETGAIVPVGDPQALAEACYQQLSRPEAARQAQGEQSRIRMRDHFDIRAVYQRHAELWQGQAADSLRG